MASEICGGNFVVDAYALRAYIVRIMKTSLVVKLINGFRRASIPDDGPDAAKLLVGYIPPHTAHGWNGKGETEWEEGERVSAGAALHSPKRGKVNEVRWLDETSVAELEAIDAERAQLHERLRQLQTCEQNMLSNMYPHCKPITLAEAKEWGRVKKEMYAAHLAAENAKVGAR